MKDSLVGEACSLESLVGRLADEFLRRQEAGERPDVEEYIARYPQAADVLRNVLASLRLLDASLPGVAEPGASAPAEGAAGILGDFRLLREVGRGGMGIVYEAEQLSLRRRVALKVLPYAGVLDPRQLQRFHNEAQAAACLHHTNIVPVYFVGSERGVHFYAMQFIDGQTLAALIDQQRQAAVPADPTTAYQSPDVPAPPAAETVVAARPATRSGSGSKRSREDFRKVAELGVQAAEALDHAHQAGIVHRDIKPANLMLDERGTLWVTDFGLAHVQHSEASLTMTGDLVGTLRYMSPEQALAKRVVIDHRTDVYSLGATLYELLTLRPAFDGKDRQELLRQVAFEEPPRPRRLDRSIPAELETIVLKAMEKNPNERYTTAKELAQDLGRYVRDEPIRARRPSLAQRARKWARRHKTIVTAGTVMLGLAVLSLATTTVLIASAYQAEAKEREKAQKAEREEADHRRTAERERALAERRLYLSDMQRAQKAWETGDKERLQQLLEKHRPGEDQRDYRGWEWYYLQTMCHKALLTVDEGPTLGSPQVVWSPDGRRLATNGNKTGIHIRDAATGKIESTLHEQGSHGCSSITWNPDGRRLASCLRTDGWIKIWNLTTGRVESTLQTQFLGVRRVAWDPAGRRLVAAGDSVLKVWDVAAGKEVFRLSAGPIVAGQPGRWIPGDVVAWSPKGDRLAVGNEGITGDSYTVKILDTTRWQELAKVHRPVRAAVWTLAWSPDGRQLAIGTAWEGDGQIEIVDVATGKEVLPLPDAFFTVVWSPDGRRLAGRSQKPFQGIKIWDAKTGKVLSTLRGHTSALSQVAWSPDGSRLASATSSGEIKVWDTSREQEHRALRGHEGSVLSVAWSSDGTRLASGSADRRIKIWDLSTDKPPLTLAGSEREVRGLAWSPDGRQLASAAGPKARVWDAVMGKEFRTLVGRTSRVSGFATVGAVAWGPGGRWLVSENVDGTLNVWETTTGREVQRLDHQAIGMLHLPVWSPDGRWLAAGNKSPGGPIHIWDTATWQQRLPLAGHSSSVQALAWSPDSRQLASASWGKTIKLWDLGTREVISTLPGHAAEVSAVAWSPDGQRLASAGRDGAIKIWDVATGEELLNLPEQALALCWSPDGRRLGSGSADGTVKIWDASPGYNVPRPPPVTTKPDQRQELAETQTGLGQALAPLSRPQEAEAAFRRALALQEGLIAEFPDFPFYRERLIHNTLSFAKFLEESRRLVDAEQVLRTALDRADSWTSRYLLADLRNFLARLLTKMGDIPRAAEEYLRLAQLAPDMPPYFYRPWLLNNVAWFLATCSDPKYRDPPRAVELAMKAVQLPPPTGEHWNTLGVSHYRAGDWKAAITAMQKAISLRQGGDSCDFFFLAMANWQVGEEKDARDWYDKAVQWMDKNKPKDEELIRFRAEAAALLGIKASPK